MNLSENMKLVLNSVPALQITIDALADKAKTLEILAQRAQKDKSVTDEQISERLRQSSRCTLIRLVLADHLKEVEAGLATFSELTQAPKKKLNRRRKSS